MRVDPKRQQGPGNRWPGTLSYSGQAGKERGLTWENLSREVMCQVTGETHQKGNKDWDTEVGMTTRSVRCELGWGLLGWSGETRRVDTQPNLHWSSTGFDQSGEGLAQALEAALLWDWGGGTRDSGASGALLANQYQSISVTEQPAQLSH